MNLSKMKTIKSRSPLPHFNGHLYLFIADRTRVQMSHWSDCVQGPSLEVCMIGHVFWRLVLLLRAEDLDQLVNLCWRQSLPAGAKW